MPVLFEATPEAARVKLWTRLVRVCQAVSRRSLSRVGRWWLMGMLVGSIVAVANSWFLHDRITQTLMTQSTARAMEHVQFGLLGRLRAQDFAPPHTPEVLADIQDLLDPVLLRMSADGSGTLGVDLLAPDGGIIYSNQPGMAGHQIPAAEQALLAEALRGRVATMIDLTGRHHEASTGTRYDDDSTLDVYVPVVIDGVVVGAYELDIGLPASRWSQPLGLTLAGGAAGGLLVLLRLGTARLWRQVHGREPIRPPEHPQPILGSSAPAVGAGTAEHLLSQRELEVLRLLAGGHSYRNIAAQLVLSEETVRSHVKRILRKTGQHNRTAAVTAALRDGLIHLTEAGGIPRGTRPETRP